MQKTIKSIFFAIFYLSISSQIFAQEFIYRITVNQKKVLTGFKLAGQSGIVTCLHGVVGYQTITVSQISNVLYDDDIKIVSWDLAKDVCIISSKKIGAIPQNSGLKLSNITSNSGLKGANVVVKGFPWSVPQYQSITAKLDGDHARELLENILPAGGNRKALATRGSPAIDKEVINIHGAIYSGHSGAPILFNDEVIGIVDGGLLMGPGYAWGIIYKEVHFAPFNSDTNYKNILSTNNALFSNEPTYTSTDANFNLSNPSEEPVSVMSVTKQADGTLDFRLNNISKIDLTDVFVYVRYYGDDLSDVLASSMSWTNIPLGQSAHIKISKPSDVKEIKCVQYDILKIGYPQVSTTYKRTYLNCDL